MMKEIFLIFIFEQGRLNERSLFSAREEQLLSRHTGNIPEVLIGLFKGFANWKIKSFSNFAAGTYFLGFFSIILNIFLNLLYFLELFLEC